MRTMYDAVVAANIPTDAEVVAGYLDGPESQWKPLDWARFPLAVKVGIVVFADNFNGHVLDVESGDATPGQAPGWVLRRRQQGCDPTVYCNMSTWPAVRQAFALSGVAEPHYWIANPTGQPHLLEGTVATQWAFQGGFDESEVLDFWPGVDNGQTIQPVPPPSSVGRPTPAPAPVPAPAPSLAPAPAATPAQVSELPEVSKAYLQLVAAILAASQGGS